jgi:hypothetical protein
MGGENFMTLLVDCPEKNIGALPNGLDTPNEKLCKDGVIVHGDLLIPHALAHEIRHRTGCEVGSFSRGALQAVLAKAAKSGIVFEDHNPEIPTDLIDMLYLTDDERCAQMVGGHEHSFCDRLSRERSSDSLAGVTIPDSM